MAKNLYRKSRSSRRKRSRKKPTPQALYAIAKKEEASKYSMPAFFWLLLSLPMYTIELIAHSLLFLWRAAVDVVQFFIAPPVEIVLHFLYICETLYTSPQDSFSCVNYWYLSDAEIHVSTLRDQIARLEARLDELEKRPVTVIASPAVPAPALGPSIHIPSAPAAPAAPAIPAPAPPPPPPIIKKAAPPPPPMMAIKNALKKPMLKRVQPVKKQESTASAGISLSALLNARSSLKNKPVDLAQKPKPKGGQGLALTLSDLTNVSLRKTARKAPRPEKENFEAPDTPVFRLKKTGMKRSPGGTPMRTMVEDPTASTTNMLTNALRKKFKSVPLGSPESNHSSPSQSPMNSPAKSSPLKFPVSVGSPLLR